MGEEAHVDGLNDLMTLVQNEIQATRFLTGLSTLPHRVKQAFLSVPRFLFVPEADKAYAHCNIPLPIGYGQTISQPFIVALMTGVLNPTPQDTVLEIGTGSGYQTAILSRLARQVYSIELIKALSDRARQTLDGLGLRNITLKCAEGSTGWAEHAPYDSIIVTAAARHIPPALLHQLKAGGKMIIPIEEEGGLQNLHLLSKDETGKIQDTPILPVTFVPFKNGGG